MSIYKENIRTWQFIRPAFRVLSNVYYIFRADEKVGKPFGIKFETSAICNLRCIMCPLSKGLKRKQGLLSFENFRKIYDEITPPYLNLTGIGEPLLNPDLFKIIKYARKNGTIVKLDTNATLLNKENIERLLNSRLSIISISIDDINKKNYEKIRKGSDFDQVMNNLKNLIETRNRLRSNTKIHINFVLQRENINEIINFIKFMDNLGVDSINGDIALPLGANKNINNRKIDKNLILELKGKLKKIKTRASLNIEHINEFFDCQGDISKKKNGQCFYAWYYPSITWDGNVVPCCYVCDNEIVFGNAIEEGFMNVWNNKKTKDFRKMIAKERRGFCSGCFIDESYIKNKIKILHKIPILKRFSKRKNI